MSDLELAAFVSSRLRDHNIDVVLSGGACVAIYSARKYVSMDLDLINTKFVNRNRIRSVMQEIGFREQNRYFCHPDTEYLIEFPPGPLSVGNEPVKDVSEISVETGMIRLLSATDCVKDRLTWYYHNDDRQCLQQAILVAQNTKVDLNEIQRWSETEGMRGKFIQIRESLAIPPDR